MFTAALFTKIKENCKLPKCPLIVEWVNKLLRVHTNGYNLALKKFYTLGYV